MRMGVCLSILVCPCMCGWGKGEREFIDKRRFSRAVVLTLWEQEDLFSVNGFFCGGAGGREGSIGMPRGWLRCAGLARCLAGLLQ